MNEQDLKKAADAAGKAFGDASKASNDFVQAEGPGAASFIKKALPWAALAIGVIFLAYALG